MLSFISWSEFIWFLVFILVPYYLVVLSLYYRSEFFAFMRNPSLRRDPDPRRGPGFQAEGNLPEAESINSPQTFTATSSHDDISLSVIHDLLEDLKKVFAVASKTRMVKEELLQAIRVKLKSYPGLQGSDLQEDIGQHIKIETKSFCGISLDVTDLKQLWNT